MKNKSWQYPFETLDDKYFDSNKDGELDSFETFFRDMHLNEMNQKADEYCKIESERKQYTVHNYKDTNTNDNKSIENNTSSGVQLFVILLVIAVLIGSCILAFSIEGTMFVRALIMFAAVGISISLLKLVGLYE